MKYNITGGFGFIGSTLASRLIKEGHEVFILDNFSTGSIHNLTEKELAQVEFMPYNSALTNLKEKFDAIFHLGMPSSSPMYREDRYKLVEALNVTLCVFEYARSHKIPVIYASSSSLYNGLRPPHKEDMPIAPTDYYSEVRMFMERLAKVYNDFYGVKSVGLRFFSVYGKREKYKRQFANSLTQFCKVMRQGIRPVVFGDGKQTRDFIHVDDVVEAIILSEKYCKRGKTDIFNVGTGHETSFNEIVKMLNQHLGTKIKPLYRKNPIKNYVPRTRADTTKMKRATGFIAKTSLKEGIERTYGLAHKRFASITNTSSEMGVGIG